MSTQPDQPTDTGPEDNPNANEDLHGAAADVDDEMSSDENDTEGPTPGGG